MRKSTVMKKLLLLLVFCAGFIACSPPTECCLAPPEPIETAVNIVKDWEPREAVQVEEASLRSRITNAYNNPTGFNMMFAQSKKLPIETECSFTK